MEAIFTLLQKSLAHDPEVTKSGYFLIVALPT